LRVAAEWATCTESVQPLKATEKAIPTVDGLSLCAGECALDKKGDGRHFYWKSRCR
jgi:hypothetical protein